MTRLSLLVDLAAQLSREVDLDGLLGTACERLADALAAERATLWLVDAESGKLITQVAKLPDDVPSLSLAVGEGVAGWVAAEGVSVRVDDAASDPRFDPSADKVTGFQTRNMLASPVRDGKGAPVRGVIQVLNRRDGPFDDDDARYLDLLATQLGQALALTTLRAHEEREPGVVLRGPFNHIVGRSPAMDEVYERISLAAETDARVLLRGETGTGKTLLARAVHVNSGRQGGPFVVVDCTTLPEQLVESELFGHERGAFTGASQRVLGKVELARGGTLFIDEVGDLPLPSQAKLLRLVQEGRFERVGGRTMLETDARILCATHRDLEAEVAAGRFREDLYYRIRVVEIVVPPLRERGPDEVERLALHFATHYAKRHGRPRPVLTDEALALLRAHPWPGNVRELEHWVESAVVLSRDGHLAPPRLLPRASVEAADSAARGPDTHDAGGLHLPLDLPLASARRRYALAVLEACGGNKAAAARRLAIGRNTLERLLREADEGASGAPSG